MKLTLSVLLFLSGFFGVMRMMTARTVMDEIVAAIFLLTTTVLICTLAIIIRLEEAEETKAQLPAGKSSAVHYKI